MSGGVGEWGSGGDAAAAGVRSSSRFRWPLRAHQATSSSGGARGGRGIRGAATLPLLLLLLLGGCGLPRWPVQGTITSPYGLRMVGWSPEVHRGVDIAVPDGTPVVAMSGGTVSFAGQQSGYGTVVVLHHHGSTYTVYGHLSRVEVKAGERVAGGQVIALSGHSGNARGPHLHFEVRRWGEAEDPVPLLGGHP